MFAVSEGYLSAHPLRIVLWELQITSFGACKVATIAFRPYTM